jgi:hypothetical protein
MFTSRHHPSGGAVAHCDNTQLERAITSYKAGDAGSLGEIIRLVEPRVLTLVRFHKTHHYRPEDELLSDVNFKLLRAVGKFDPAKGSVFSYVSKIIDSSLKTSVSNQRRNWSRCIELDGELTNTLRAKAEDWAIADDLIFKVKSRARTTLTNEIEISAQRWFIESFCQEGFAAKRHTCSDICMSVYQLSHARSRELHDLSALEVRRALFDDLHHREQVSPGHLLGTRCVWMTNYQPLLSPAEFTKFYVLMKNLAPYLLLLIIDPARANNHRRDRNPTIGRRNLELVLYGNPSATPLF